MFLTGDRELADHYIERELASLYSMDYDPADCPCGDLDADVKTCNDVETFAQCFTDMCSGLSADDL